MKYIEYPLYAEGYINRFLTTGVDTREESFTKATLHGRVNEWLKYGFSIHENPCRRELIEARRRELPEYVDLSRYRYGEAVRVLDGEQRLQLYTPFGNIGMEVSGFYYTPTYLRSYSYAVIKAERTETVSFELMTCGGLTLWVNDELVTQFTPFTRNMVGKTKVQIRLQAGENKFIICLDDLAERDTDYYFRIRRVGESPLMICLPVDETVNARELRQLEMMLEQMYFKKEEYISEPVLLQLTNECRTALPVEVAIVPGEFIETMEHQQSLVSKRSYQLAPAQKSLTLLHADEIRPGYYYFVVTLRTGGIELKRRIGNELVRAEFLNMKADSPAERKQQALDVLIRFGVENVYQAAVYFKQNLRLKEAERIITDELPGIRARKDCSDFHFIIVLYCYRTFSEQMTEHLKTEIEEVMLGYRYWIDEPGDDVMWFFSENHALLFHICQYLAGSWLPEQLFTNSGLTGSELGQKAELLLEQWFESFFDEFITEWNSSAYIPVDVLGLGTLYNLTGPGSVWHEKARRALDLIFYALCINGHKGAVMTSFGRTYEKELKGNHNAGTTALLYIAYQAGCINRAAIGMISLILGDYQAPEEYARYLRLTDNQVLIHENTQGFEQHVNLYLYKNADVLLSTAVGFKPYQPGYQEHIVQATIDKCAQVFVNHPGESQPYGSGRPNFWAGNGVLPMAMQYRNLSILHYLIPEEHRIDYTHAYIPLSEFKQYLGESHAMVLEKDGGYIGVRTMNRLEIQQDGPCRHREFISRGRENVWVLMVARKRDYPGLEAFLEEMKNVDIQIRNHHEVAVRTAGGTLYQINRNRHCTVNGAAVYHYPRSAAGTLTIEG